MTLFHGASHRAYRHTQALGRMLDAICRLVTGGCGEPYVSLSYEAILRSRVIKPSTELRAEQLRHHRSGCRRRYRRRRARGRRRATGTTSCARGRTTC